uniref:Uncharacterized protein n=1 Tax=Panagrolaimus sp. JU765 TaxID=591449 RepID=A0AC34QIL7_9BILA
MNASFITCFILIGISVVCGQYYQSPYQQYYYNRPGYASGYGPRSQYYYPQRYSSYGPYAGYYNNYYQNYQNYYYPRHAYASTTYSVASPMEIPGLNLNMGPYLLAKENHRG